MTTPDNRNRPKDNPGAKREAHEASTRPSGPDKAYAGAGYAGPGGFGGGYGGEPARQERDGPKKDAKPVPRKPNKDGN